MHDPIRSARTKVNQSANETAFGVCCVEVHLTRVVLAKNRGADFHFFTQSPTAFPDAHLGPSDAPPAGQKTDASTSELSHETLLPSTTRTLTAPGSPLSPFAPGAPCGP